VLGFVSVEDTDLSFVAVRSYDFGYELVPGCDAAAAEYERDALAMPFFSFNDEVSVALVFNFARWSAHFDFFADRHAVENIPHGSAGLVAVREIRLHDKFKRAVLFFI